MDGVLHSCITCGVMLLRTSSSPAAHTLLQITQSIVFVTIIQFYQDLLELPWAIYSTFVLEQKHGFNNQVLL